MPEKGKHGNLYSLREVFDAIRVARFDAGIELPLSELAEDLLGFTINVARREETTHPEWIKTTETPRHFTLPPENMALILAGVHRKVHSDRLKGRRLAESVFHGKHDEVFEQTATIIFSREENAQKYIEMAHVPTPTERKLTIFTIGDAIRVAGGLEKDFPKLSMLDDWVRDSVAQVRKESGDEWIQQPKHPLEFDEKQLEKIFDRLKRFLDETRRGGNMKSILGLKALTVLDHAKENLLSPPKPQK